MTQEEITECFEYGYDCREGKLFPDTLYMTPMQRFWVKAGWESFGLETAHWQALLEKARSE